MGFWTGRTPRNLTLFETNGNKLILPFGTAREILPMIREGEIETDFRQDDPIDYGETVPLYPYQQQAVDEMLKKTYGILKSPPGSGKTQMGIALIKGYGRRTLWLCHTADLLRQSRDRAKRYIRDDLIGTITEGKVNIGAGVTFATVQTMCNLDLPAYRDEWDVVIVDEAHRISGSATQMTRYYKVLSHLAARHKIGLTATPERSDGLIRATFALIGGIAYEVPEQDVADKVMRVSIRPVSTETTITEDCLYEDGTINFTALIGHLCEDETRNKLIASHIEQNREHSCLILSDRLQQLETIMTMLPDEMRKKAVYINGKMNSKAQKELREAAIEQMRTGEKQYLFASYSLAKEGLDIQRLDRLFLASPVKYSAIVTQSVGRVARTFDGKEQPIVYDFVDSQIGFCKRAYTERKKHYRRMNAVTEEERREEEEEKEKAQQREWDSRLEWDEQGWYYNPF